MINIISVNHNYPNFIHKPNPCMISLIDPIFMVKHNNNETRQAQANEKNENNVTTTTPTEVWYS